MKNRALDGHMLLGVEDSLVEWDKMVSKNSNRVLFSARFRSFFNFEEWLS